MKGEYTVHGFRVVSSPKQYRGVEGLTDTESVVNSEATVRQIPLPLKNMLEKNNPLRGMKV